VAAPKKQTPIDLGSLARAHTVGMVETLAGYANGGVLVEPDIRIRAISMLLDRGWGKPAQTHQHTGADGANEITVILRTIVEGKK